ncbi:lysophospholipase [Moraxella nasicaprae]|uniref:Lysophospholipase n=1 Tax=Moraxella nasicaprae TaxID=2904122 RepID=A0ABY6F2S2_9GAMM|nr:lysophospholipase [Moraxella nasicaprae]UXZ04365.1 lysophospholipase [Moraxella nasicaprae]
MTSKTILSSNGIHRLHHTFFVPTGEIKASLLIVHGMSEHGGRYAKFAKFLADNGILVATYDQLGHGQTVKDKYELGFIDEKHPVQTLCKDVIIMADQLKELAPNVAHFIMGHSMGSFIVRTVLTHHSTRFAGAILMGTGNHHGIKNRLGLGILSTLNAISPKKTNSNIASLLNHHLLSQLRSPISASPFAWLAENPHAIKAFESDPLCGFCFTNNGFYTLMMLIKQACLPTWYQHMSQNYPILLVSGKDDPVGNLGQDIINLQEELLKAGKPSPTMLLYPNMRHEPLHETAKLGVYRDILSWLIKSM